MQAIYAWYCTDYQPAKTFEYNLEEYAEKIRSQEQSNGDKGDLRLLTGLFYNTIDRQDELDRMIQAKAENWELERIALLDRILMQMGICEMLSFPEIPIKVTINEYLEIAKKFSTPKSSKFINGILDSLYVELKSSGNIEKRGRGLIEESVPRKGIPMSSPRGQNELHDTPSEKKVSVDANFPRPFDEQKDPKKPHPDQQAFKRSGPVRPRISRNPHDRPQSFQGRQPGRFDRDKTPLDFGERRKPKLRLILKSDRHNQTGNEKDQKADLNFENSEKSFRMPTNVTAAGSDDITSEQPKNITAKQPKIESQKEFSVGNETQDSEE